jgi:hypothetical protein
MGLFDYVVVDDPNFICSEGHDLRVEEFQSKDFGCTMGTVSIVLDGMVRIENGGFGGDLDYPLNGHFYIYAGCTRCPAFVQVDTYNLIAHMVEFKITVIDGMCVRIERHSPSTKEWIENEPKQQYMENCIGPMPWKEAYALHIDHLMSK